METKKTNSKIINVFFESQITKKKMPDLELHDLKNIFKVFGKIKKIIIYDRREMIKSFIEFQTIKSVKNLIKIINGKKINNFGNCRVTISEKRKLEVKNKFTEFIDYNTHDFNFTDCLKNKAFEFENLKNKEENEEIDFRGQFREVRNMMGFMKQKDLKNDGNYFWDEMKSFGILKNENNPFLGNFNHLGDDIKKKIFLEKEENSFLKQLKKIISYQQKNNNFFKKSDYNNKEQKNLILKNKLLLLKKKKDRSKVLIISNLEDFSKVSEILNLFSCFGDIKKILFMKNKKNAFIEFTSFAFAENSFIYMNDQKIINSKIVVSFSKSIKQIDLKKNLRSENAKLYNQTLKVKNEQKKFLNHFGNFLNPPSNKILAIFENKYDFEIKFLRDFFDSFLGCKEFLVLENGEFLQIGIVYRNLEEGIFIMAKCGMFVIKGLRGVLFFA